ncbi:FecR domain-containing protein [Aliifodinibius sp. S!AR15-10]|nr:FecR domain-containing protein [Aliifodinibius sp. S!AR15-10]
MKTWDNWIKESPRNKKLAEEAQEKILGMDFVHANNQDIGEEWDELEERINKNNAIENFGITPPSRDSKSHWIFKVAAAILVAAVTGITTYLIQETTTSPQKEPAQIEWKTIETEYQQQKTIALSDGSTIRLNANSSITYPAGWVRGNVTEVYLEGEAYFDIASRENGKEPPFKVITDDGVIEVMGTKFVVASGEKDTRVGLEEGKVSIQRRTKSDKSSLASDKHLMEPNELAHFSNEMSTVEIKPHPNLEVFTSWIDNQLTLDSSPLSYLIYRIERTFGVEVVVNNKELYTRKLTGTIKLKDLEHLTQSLSEVMGEQVSLSEGTVFFGNKH